MNGCGSRSGPAAHFHGEIGLGKYGARCGDGARAATGSDGNPGVGDGAVSPGCSVGETRESGADSGEQPRS
ncbi:hypothetical protein CWI46_01345 [Neisseria meningitidis]|nr:hypothetical protein CWI46_01345 [Neisseria meningitidis]